jgi:hypothetical protein
MVSGRRENSTGKATVRASQASSQITVEILRLHSFRSEQSLICVRAGKLAERLPRHLMRAEPASGAAFHWLLGIGRGDRI